MNQYEVKMQARRLMASQEKFVATVYALFEVVEGLNNRLASFQKYLQSLHDLSKASKEVQDTQHEMSQKLYESLQAMVKAFSETNVMINENSERTQKLLSKVEAYFGTTGLDYDN